MYAIPWSRTRASNCFHKENAKSVFYSNWKFLTFWLFTFLNGNIHQIHRILQLGREKWNHPKKPKPKKKHWKLWVFCKTHWAQSPPKFIPHLSPPVQKKMHQRNKQHGVQTLLFESLFHQMTKTHFHLCFQNIFTRIV